MGKGTLCECGLLCVSVRRRTRKKNISVFRRLLFDLFGQFLRSDKKNYKLLKYLMGTTVLLNASKKEISDCIELSDTKVNIFDINKLKVFCMERSCKQCGR